MKRTIPAAIALLSALGLTACGTPQTKPVAQVAEVTPAVKKFTIFFDPSTSEITENGARIVQTAAVNADTGTPTLVFVMGHTDTSGDRAENVALSDRRAAAVKAMLIANGIPAADIVIGGTGEADLRVPTANGVDKAQNRRVVITEMPVPEKDSENAP